MMMQAEVEHLEKINATKIESQREVIALNGIIIERQVVLNIAIVFCGTCSNRIFIYDKRKKTLGLLLDRKVNQGTL